MGQRSQIYVRVDNELIIANYYGWNYAERMISRARYGIECLKYYIDNGYTWCFKSGSQEVEKIRRMFDVNFDYKDIVMSTDILREWTEYGSGDFSDFVFNQDNNDGMLFIWIDTENKTIKYCFSDYDSKNPLDCDNYMIFDTECCYEDYKFPAGLIKSKQMTTYNRNKKYIEKNAQLMTAAELKDFKNIHKLSVKTA